MMRQIILNTKFYIFAIAVILTCGVSHAEVTFKATLDSATLLMSKQTIIHVEIVQDASQRGIISNEPKGADSVVYITDNVEFGGIVRNDTTSLGNNRQQINRDYVIQSFDSGLYTIPPFKYVVGADTIDSKPLTLKVLPVPVDSVLETITDYAEIENIDNKWYDWVPDWILDYWGLILIVLILILGVIAVIYLYKANGKTLLPKKKRTPPYELAKQRLSKLKKQNLCEKGQEKSYYTELTDILREYLAGRFNIYALEMTTAQILDALNGSDEAKEHKKLIEEVLQIADYVKFAKVKPLAEENTRSYQCVAEFVENTKPVVIENDNSKAKGVKQKQVKITKK